ncbi:MAG: SMI1/KNR4 family protein [Labilithrix sp.]|nr:SMI1/KNR4 family protein [Labilithrix sp.]MBX3215825.1 SMI1/KNR4 family protein [Labilithrix sp.]
MPTNKSPSGKKRSVAKRPLAERTAATPRTKSELSAGAFDAAACWARIERWFVEHHPELDLELRPGAKEKEIDAAETRLGVTFPADFRASLRVHDGQDDEPRLFLLPFSERLGSLKSMVACSKSDRPSYDARDTEGRFEWLDDSRRVRQVHFHPKHVAFAGRKYWDHGRLMFDFVPGPEGRAGQIIALADVDFVFVCSSFGELLERTASGLEQGAITLEAAGYDYVRLRYGSRRGEEPVTAAAFFG